MSSEFRQGVFIDQLTQAVGYILGGAAAAPNSATADALLDLADAVSREAAAGVGEYQVASHREQLERLKDSLLDAEFKAAVAEETEAALEDLTGWDANGAPEGEHYVLDTDGNTVPCDCSNEPEVVS